MWSVSHALYGRGNDIIFVPMMWHWCADGLMQDSSNSSALAVELLQSSTKSSIYW